METRTVLVIIGLVAVWAVLQFFVFPKLGLSCCAGKGCGGKDCAAPEGGCKDACDAPCAGAAASGQGSARKEA